MQILDFEWDEGNTIHLQLGHGIEPEEAESDFAFRPFFKRTKKSIMWLSAQHLKEGTYLLSLS